jgi:probable selenium-dependent hydroxylase accessory protein YqeC
LLLAELLLPLLPRPEPGGVIALVGAGGKTAALFGLGGELAAMGPSGALLTTTTHIYDPRLEPGRPFDQVVLDPALAGPGGEGAPWTGAVPGRGRRIVLAAEAEPGLGKLRGIHPSRVADLARTWPFIVVEADGARRLPIKAPAEYEPALPAGAGLVLGLVGLDCLGRPMDGATVHRPERFGPVAGCAPGEPIRLEHLLALARSPRGLFQGAPAGARRVLVLNKADLYPGDPAQLCAAFAACGAELVLVCALGRPEPGQRVLAMGRH